MAQVIVELPDGELCGGCKFRVEGTIWCSLFGDYLKENEDYTDKYKCKRCPRE